MVEEDTTSALLRRNRGFLSKDCKVICLAIQFDNFLPWDNSCGHLSQNFHRKFVQHISVGLPQSFSQNCLIIFTLPHSSGSSLASAEKSDNFWVCSFVYILNDRSALRTNTQTLAKITLISCPLLTIDQMITL